MASHSKALIKLDKTCEEPKSTAAGERKELMLKNRSLLLICGPVWFLGHAYVLMVMMRRPRGTGDDSFMM